MVLVHQVCNEQHDTSLVTWKPVLHYTLDSFVHFYLQAVSSHSQEAADMLQLIVDSNKLSIEQAKGRSQRRSDIASVVE